LILKKKSKYFIARILHLFINNRRWRMCSRIYLLIIKSSNLSLS